MPIKFICYVILVGDSGSSNFINWHHCELNAALIPSVSTHFLVENLYFHFFQSLGSLGTNNALCYLILVGCVDFTLLKTKHDGRTMCQQDFPLAKEGYVGCR